MKRPNHLRSFALLVSILFATVGVILLLMLQLAPVARQIANEVGTSMQRQSTGEKPTDSTTRATVTSSRTVRSLSTILADVVPSRSTTTSPTAARTVMIFATPTAPVSATPPLTATIAAIATPAPQRAVVIVSLVNVRGAPSLTGELLAQLVEDDIVTILATSDDQQWYQVCCPLSSAAVQQAWVSADLLQPLSATEPEHSVVAAQPISDSRSQKRSDLGQQGAINADTVNVRSGPGLNYAIVGQATEATIVTIIGRTVQNDWLKICCVKSLADDGWISAQFVDLIMANSTIDRAQLLADLPIPPTPIPPRPVSPAADPVALSSTAAGAASAGNRGAGLPGAGNFSGPGGQNPLTGLPLAAGRNGQRPLIVCINNDPAARPQLGLSQADIIYEYLMEGYGITRFSAIFYGDDVAAIGPVRSARLINYYMGALYDAGLVCSGASDQVRYALKHEAPFPYMDIDLDDPSNSRYSVSIGSDYRTRLRTNTSGGRQWLADWGVEKAPSLRGFNFGPIEGGSSATQIEIPYPRGAGSQVSYRYDGASGRYLRWLGGSIHTDGNTGGQLAVDNVIVQYVPHEATNIVEDSLGSTSIRLNLFGSGRALLFRDGVVHSGSWRSDSRGDTPHFYDESGNELRLRPGRSWISVVPQTYTIVYQ